MRGIMTVNIQRRIRFGIPGSLCRLQRLLKRLSSLLHTGQDEVARAVQNAVYSENIVCHQALLQGADDRNSAAYTGFKVNLRLVFARQLKLFSAMRGQQGLVGCHHRLTAAQRPRHQFPCHPRAANQLHHNVHIIRIYD